MWLRVVEVATRERRVLLDGCSIRCFETNERDPSGVVEDELPARALAENVNRAAASPVLGDDDLIHGAGALTERCDERLSKQAHGADDLHFLSIRHIADDTPSLVAKVVLHPRGFALVATRK